MTTFYKRAALGVLLGLVAFHGVAIGAEGGSAAEADRLIASGVSLRQAGKDEEALAEFSKAYELSHGAHARAQMGIAEQALGRWDLAEAHLAEALGDTNDAWIKKHRTDLEAALEEVRGHLGTLDVLGGVPGAEVRVNGQTVTHLPLTAPLRLPAGTVVLEIVADGYVPSTRTVTITAGRLGRETFYLVKEATASPTPPGPSPAVTSPTSPAAPAAVVTSEPTQSSSSVEWRKPGAWIAAGAAAVALGVGTAFTIRMYSNQDSFNQSCGLDTYKTLTGSPCAGYHDRATSSQVPAITGLAVGAVLAGASGYLFWSNAHAHATPTTQARSTWRCLPGVSTPGISCGASFF
jgi:hypothetical protein